MRAQIEKTCDLGKDARDSRKAVHLIARNKGKEPIIPDDVDTTTDDELSSCSSPFLSLSLAKNAWESIKAKSRKRPSHLPALSDAVSGASRRARREEGRRQNQPVQAQAGMIPPMPFVHPTFGTRPTVYMLLAALIRRPDDMLSSSLGQHILDYEPPCRFFIPAFATFDGSTNPYDHILHYN